jgi:hypothetical protein
MLLVYTKDGECVDVMDATSAMRLEDSLLCFDADGHVIRTFLLADVSLYTADSATADLIRDEACDEEDEQSAALT